MPASVQFELLSTERLDLRCMDSARADEQWLARMAANAEPPFSLVMSKLSKDVIPDLPLSQVLNSVLILNSNSTM